MRTGPNGCHRDPYQRSIELTIEVSIRTPGREVAGGRADESTGLEAVAHRPSPSLRQLFSAYFVVGSTAFGMATLQSVRSVTVKRGWLSLAEIDEGLGLVQLYPGAMMVDLVTYIGYRTRRVRGALVAAAGFVAPSLGLMLGLSWLYAAYGATPGMSSMVVARRVPEYLLALRHARAFAIQSALPDLLLALVHLRCVPKAQLPRRKGPWPTSLSKGGAAPRVLA